MTSWLTPKTQETFTQEVKRQPIEWEKILANQISDNIFVSNNKVLVLEDE